MPKPQPLIVISLLGGVGVSVTADGALLSIAVMPGVHGPATFLAAAISASPCPACSTLNCLENRLACNASSPAADIFLSRTFLKVTRTVAAAIRRSWSEVSCAGSRVPAETVLAAATETVWLASAAFSAANWLRCAGVTQTWPWVSLAPHVALNACAIGVLEAGCGVLAGGLIALRRRDAHVVRRVGLPPHVAFHARSGRGRCGANARRHEHDGRYDAQEK